VKQAETDIGTAELILVIRRLTEGCKTVLGKYTLSKLSPGGRREVLFIFYFFYLFLENEMTFLLV
jgi:hypothetical protein